MAASTFGPKNEPQFADGDAPDVAVNPTQAAAYAAKLGNRRVDTGANRTTASGKDVWDGLEWYDTTNKGRYEYIGGWVRRQVIRLGRARLSSATVVTAANPSWMDVLTVTADSTGGICFVEVDANVYNPNSGAARTANLRVVCDGTLVDGVWQVDVPFISGTSTAGVTAVVRAESTPGAGTHTWKLQANAGATGSSVSVRVAVMTVQEV